MKITIGLPDKQGVTFTDVVDALRSIPGIDARRDHLWIEIHPEGEVCDESLGWIEWGGGECPVAEGAHLEILMRDGRKADGEAGDFFWEHYGGDIVEYRLLPGDDEINQGQVWTRWKGGPCPVRDDYLVEVRLRDGRVIDDFANTFYWMHLCGSDIVAYRILSEEG